MTLKIQDLAARLPAPLLRRMPPGTGAFRLAAWIYEHFLREAGGTATQRLRSGAVVSLDLSDWPQAQAFLLGVYERSLIEFAAARLSGGGVFVDGGCACRSRIVRDRSSMSRRPGPRIRTTSRSGGGFHAQQTFEPIQSRHAQPTRLSERPCILELDLSTHAVGSSGHRIEAIPLDDYLAENGIEGVDLLKLDLEGHELQALRGADRALSEGRIKSVVIEAMVEHASRTGADPVAAQRYLEDRGYVKARLPTSSLDRWRALMHRPMRESNVAFALAPPAGVKPFQGPS